MENEQLATSKVKTSHLGVIFSLLFVFFTCPYPAVTGGISLFHNITS
jgi:hypothetical protein